MSTVMIIGAINLDCVAFVPYFPPQGIHMRAKELKCCLGGRGANQAVALNHLKMTSFLLGKVGNDFAGDYVLSILKKYKINTEYIFKSNRDKTGICSIVVSPNGENTIIGFPAINRTIQPDFLKRFEHLFELAEWLSISLEYPLETVSFALKLAKKYGLKTVLDPSPLIDLPKKDLWLLVDYILPNHKELKILSGEEEMLRASLMLRDWGIGEIIIKQGSAGCSFLHENRLIHVPAFAVRTVIDTTGAGDLFDAAFIYGMIQSNSILRAIQIANLVASYAVQKGGTSDSFPERREIDWKQLENREHDFLF